MCPADLAFLQPLGHQRLTLTSYHMPSPSLQPLSSWGRKGKSCLQRSGQLWLLLQETGLFNHWIDTICSLKWPSDFWSESGQKIMRLPEFYLTECSLKGKWETQIKLQSDCIPQVLVFYGAACHFLIYTPCAGSSVGIEHWSKPHTYLKCRVTGCQAWQKALNHPFYMSAILRPSATLLSNAHPTWVWTST